MDRRASPLIFLLPVVPCASSLVIDVPLAFRPRLCAKNEAPEEEVAFVLLNQDHLMFPMEFAFCLS